MWTWFKVQRWIWSRKRWETPGRRPDWETPRLRRVMFCEVIFGAETRHQLVQISTLKAPLQTRGFHAGAAAYPGGDPSYIISCSDNLRCPGELPLGECPPNAFGIACTACMPGYFDSEGLCESCSESRLQLGFHNVGKLWIVVLGSTGWSKHPSQLLDFEPGSRI